MKLPQSWESIQNTLPCSSICSDFIARHLPMLVFHKKTLRIAKICACKVWSWQKLSIGTSHNVYKSERTINNTQATFKYIATDCSSVFECGPKIYTRDTRPCTILIPACGSIWGLRVFPVIKIIVGSSCAHVTCMYCCLDKHA